MTRDAADLKALILIKRDGEQYAFVYQPGQEALVPRVLGEFAAREDLSFTWYDAALLCQQLWQPEPSVVERIDA